MFPARSTVLGACPLLSAQAILSAFLSCFDALSHSHLLFLSLILSETFTARWKVGLEGAGTDDLAHRWFSSSPLYWETVVLPGFPVSLVEQPPPAQRGTQVRWLVPSWPLLQDVTPALAPGL